MSWGQVEIVAQKPLVKADIDKIEYNVQDDPDAQSNSVLEMLRKGTVGNGGWRGQYSGEREQQLQRYMSTESPTT